MYDSRTPKQQNGLIYGFKLRHIGAIQGLIGSLNHHHNFDTFTQPEIDKIQEICNNAKVRAKTVFEETRDRLDRYSDAEASSRSETVERQYNGK